MANNREISQFAGLVIVNDSTNAITIGSTLSVSGDLDVNSGGVYYNSTNNRLGINTTSADQNLHVYGNSSTTFVSVGDQTRVAPYGYFGTDADAGKVSLVSRSTHPLTFQIETSEVGRFDTSGRLLVGTSSAPTNVYPSTVAQTPANVFDSDTDQLSFMINNNSVSGNIVSFARRYTAAADGFISRLLFSQYDGSNYRTAAQIAAQIDGTPDVGDMPGRLVFSTTADGSSSPTERMRITNDTSIYMAHNADGMSDTPGFAGGLRIRRNGTTLTNQPPTVIWQGSSTSTITCALFYTGSTIVGSITRSTTATAYNTSSDYRLKENVVPLTGAIDRLNQLQVRRFNFIADPDTTVDGFLAHEAQEVVPESVTGEKDEVEAIGTLTSWNGNVIQTDVPEPESLTFDQEVVVTPAVHEVPATYDEDGNELTPAVNGVPAVTETVTRTNTWTKTGERPVYQGIDQSKLVPLLTAALQEAIAKIETLEQRLSDAGIA